MTSDFRNIRQKKIRQEAEGYLELGMAEAALRVLARSDESDPRCNFLRGEALRMLDRFQEALEPLQQAVEETPENIHIWIAMGWCYKRLDQLDLAIEALERALEIEPLEALLHYNLACYWSLAGVKWRALKYLAQALEMEADYLDMIDDEPDFNLLRFDPDFQSLCSRSGAKE